ncbi:MAG: hypothetical protein SOR38_09275 [Oscillospiraceae bacterium]|nr:hypothetical protein [Oscillospiraceae bacterium]MDY3065975.1 hypothetical protein [Oscillospiraceae bacterium]
MDVELTRNGTRFLKVIYREYRLRKKRGKSEQEARDFMNFLQWELLFPKMPVGTVKAAQIECCKALHMRLYVRNGFILNDEAIRYMERRWRTRFTKCLSYFADMLRGLLGI